MAAKGPVENIYEQHLEPVEANYTPLSPLSFIARASKIYPNVTAVKHGVRHYTWVETYARSRRLASALKARDISSGDTVAFMGANTPELYEAHFGVPMTGAVLNAINIRLDAPAIAFILNHGEAKVLFTDREFSSTIKTALELAEVNPLVIDIDDDLAPPGDLLGEIEYENFIAEGDPNF